MVVIVTQPATRDIATRPGRPTTMPEPAPPLPVWSSLFSVLGASGVVDGEAQIFADVASIFPLLGRHRCAAVLMDLRARALAPTTSRPRGMSSIRLDRMSAALVVEAPADSESVVSILNRIVGRHTNTRLARLEDRALGDDHYQRLIDKRLPAWAAWEWGRLGPFYVIALGRGAYESVARAYRGSHTALAADAWFQAAHRSIGGDGALVEWHVSFARIRSSLAEISETRTHRVFDALGAAGIERDVWAIGRAGREITCRRFLRIDGADQARLFAGDPARTRAHAAVIPPRAAHFAVLNIPSRWLVETLPEAILAAQTPRRAAAMQRFWARAEERLGVDVDQKLLKNLRDDLIVCDFPPHPISFPFALTVAISIDNAHDVTLALDTLLRVLAEHLDEGADDRLFPVALKQADDGIWYIQAGLLGPALAVTPRYIVVSWSPHALREALPFFRGP